MKLIKIQGKLISTRKSLNKQFTANIRGKPIPIIKQENKERKYAIKIDGELIPVTKEVYDAFKRPAWVERKRSKVRSDKERSYEKFVADGYDIPSDYYFEEDLVNKLITDDFLSLLTEDERCLIKDLYYKGLSLREAARKNGVSHRTIIKRRDSIFSKFVNKL